VATWQEMSRDSLRAARSLYSEELFRSSVSRAYYAAYCAVAGELAVRGVSYSHGWHNPGHDQLPDLVLNNTTLPRNTRFEINKALRRLRRAREDADYRPAATVDRRDALRVVRDASFVVQTLEDRRE
jgi:uncharacterized protein (UPF0332 family)